MPRWISRIAPRPFIAPLSMRDRRRTSKGAHAVACVVLFKPVPTYRQTCEGPMVALRNILVATDFSEPSCVALAYGRDLARNYNARLHVMHVVEDVMLRYSTEVGLALPALQEDLVATARRDLEARLTEEDRRQLSAVAVIDTGANIAASICAYAKNNAIDLIVTGTHGRGVVQHFLLGSVAERVVRSAPCPVLTVHAHERDFIVPDALTVMAGA